MIKPVSYLQSDSKWRYHNYSASGESKTISSSGCGVTAAAMLIQTLRPDLKVTPVECADWSMDHGYKYLNQGTAYAYFTPQFKEYGISCRMINSSDARYISQQSKDKIFNEVKDALRTDNNFIIACMGPGNWTKGGHYIVAYHMDESNVYINDPASTADYRIKNSISLFLAQAKYFWVIKWGTVNKVHSKGSLYSKHDASSKRTKLFSGDILYYTKDLGDGWGIACSSNQVGFIKNNIVNEVGKTKFPKGQINKGCYIYKTNNKLSDKITWAEEKTTVSIITKHKYWTNVKTEGGYKGWVKTKFINLYI